ncbi:hypothetical protein BpHYR1_000695 [Brachionus plicatilis]|uniref:Uncharacterized protein n=1 Tax=Brachionus plicatilis TaxID=10195 RepID=A0A3M7T5U6_BRAPC|nr:hypothetical protein BpHYR1_000695 [Brachionus plicatilis]
MQIGRGHNRYIRLHPAEWKKQAGQALGDQHQQIQNLVLEQTGDVQVDDVGDAEQAKKVHEIKV